MSVRCRAKIALTGGASSSTPVASGGGDIGVGACECIDRVNTPPEADPNVESDEPEH